MSINTRMETQFTYFKLPIFATGEDMIVGIQEMLCDTISDYQHIQIATTKEYGLCLVIDSNMQASEYDHQQYDDLMSRCLKRGDKKILILGGGDGFLAADLIRKNPEIFVKVVDLDGVVVDQVKKHFDQNVFDRPRVQLILGDAIQYVENTSDLFDGIICDLTDAPVGAEKEQEFHDFYENIIRASHRILTDSGWITIQGGASQVSAGFIDAAEILSSILERSYSDCERLDALIPSFGEECVFLSAANKKCLPINQ